MCPKRTSRWRNRLPIKPLLWGSHDNTKITNPLVSLSSIMLCPQKKLCPKKTSPLRNRLPHQTVVMGNHDNTKKKHYKFLLHFFCHFPQKTTIGKGLLLFLRLNGFLLFLVLKNIMILDLKLDSKRRHQANPRLFKKNSDVRFQISPAKKLRPKKEFRLKISDVVSAQSVVNLSFWFWKTLWFWISELDSKRRHQANPRLFKNNSDVRYPRQKSCVPKKEFGLKISDIVSATKCGQFKSFPEKGFKISDISRLNCWANQFMFTIPEKKRKHFRSLKKKRCIWNDTRR